MQPSHISVTRLTLAPAPAPKTPLRAAAGPRLDDLPGVRRWRLVRSRKPDPLAPLKRTHD